VNVVQTPIIPSIDCPNPQLHSGAQGIARVAVDDLAAQLRVTFVAPLSFPRDAFLLDPASYILTGGQRLFPQVLQVSSSSVSSPPSSADMRTLVLTLNGIGDFSIYTLTVNGGSIDPFFSSRKLRFRLSCEDHFDCLVPATTSNAPAELEVNIDYLAKDYSSFRQALLDFIPTRMPRWTERSEADFGMVILELLAASGDTLSYLQDRIANEAFLSSATQRRSVAGHLALIGYQMDEGASAYTFLQFRVNAVHTISSTPTQPGLAVSTRSTSANERIIVFETLGNATLRPQHNRIPIYTWDNQSCCLPASAMNLALVGAYDDLQSGDYLLIQDTSGHRDVVRLTSKPIISATGALANVMSAPMASPPIGSPPRPPVTIVSWSAATPLHYDYCLCDASTSPPTPLSWVSANVIPATHGETVIEDIRNLTPNQLRSLQQELDKLAAGARRPRQRLPLSNAPLAHLDPAVNALANVETGPATAAASDAVSQILTREPTTIASLHLRVKGVTGEWQERQTLLNSGPEDPVFRVEIEDDGRATVVFGDGRFGLLPDESAQVVATYRVGGGTDGNIGADTLTEVRGSAPWLDAVTNALPAQGGRNLETRQHARAVGPPTSHEPLVAVTATDYQNTTQAFVTASGEQPIQRASASFRWTGSWLTATVAVEPVAGTSLPPGLRSAVVNFLDGRRLSGYDLEILPVAYLPIDVVVGFCTLSGFRPADVQQSILEVLSNRKLAGGRTGFFHSSNFTFGDSIFVSRLYAAILAVAGVEWAQITRFARLHSPNPDAETSANLAQGFLQVASDQIIRLDNDRNFPQNGSLSILPRGVNA
jgi:hypothetical protein